MNLPPLRDDLEYFEGPPDKKGAPTYTVFDPVRSLYFKLSWKEYQLLTHYKKGMTLEELHSILNCETTLQITQEEIRRFFIGAHRAELTSTPRSAEELAAIAEKRGALTLGRVFGRYLFIKIPLFNPDEFLARTLKYVRPLVSTAAWIFYALIATFGIISLATHFDDYLNTLTTFFNIKGIFVYAAAILTMKTIHEFAHAYTAKNYGVHVYSMGAALMFFLPVLYTDVTHGWRLKSRTQRVMISAAGSMAELVIGGFALLFWRISPEGAYKSAFYALSTLAIFSLFINLNPALKWDGYYMLCDLWGIDNLKRRAFNYTNWCFRSKLLGLDFEQPELEQSRATRVGLVLYTLYSWLFRLIIILGVGYFIYLNFTRLFGFALMAFALLSLIVLPAIAETRVLFAMRSKFKWNPRLIITLILTSALLIWVIFPWPHFLNFPGITVAKEEQWIHVPYAGVVERIDVTRGMQLQKGDPLITIHSEELVHELAQRETAAAQLRTQIRVLEQSTGDISELNRLKAELRSIETEIRAFQEMREDYTLRATLSGQLIEWKRELKEGSYVAQGEVLGYIARPSELEIKGFVPGRKIEEIEVGRPILFRPRGGYAPLRGTVTSISQKSTKELEHPELASLHGGDLPVVPQLELEQLTGLPEEGIYTLTQSYYVITITPEEPEGPYPFHIAGDVRYRGPWRSYLISGIKYLISLLRQEITP